MGERKGKKSETIYYKQMGCLIHFVDVFKRYFSCLPSRPPPPDLTYFPLPFFPPTVLNKYFPPDFDPSKVPRGKRVRSEEKQMKVRMMLPMSVRCNTCGNFMYKGTKFNTRMEDVKGEAYLGIKIFRFYYRCTNCSAEFCMKTDPKTADYIVEGGASRNYEPWRDKEQSAADAVAQKEEEEKGNAMKALENRTLDSKREMDILTALDEMRSLKARHETVDTETALAALRRAAAAEEEEQQPVDLDAEDEEAVRQMLLHRAGFVKRLESSSGEDSDGAAVTAGEGRERAPAGGGGFGGGGGNKALKRSKKDVGIGGRGAPLSVAAAAWEEEEQEQEDDGGDALEKDVAGANTSAQDGLPSNLKGTTPTDDVKNRQNRGAKTPAAGVGAVEGSGAAGKNGGAIEATGVAWAGPLPSSVPSFSARPAAVVVKRKNVPGVHVKKNQEQQKKLKNENGFGSGDGDGENALLGLLGGYGSSDSD